MAEHDENLRDLAAMFALTGILMRDKQGVDAIETAFDLADQFMEARKPEQGIAAIKKSRKKHVPES
jgi:hypothetical protein